MVREFSAGGVVIRRLSGELVDCRHRAPKGGLRRLPGAPAQGPQTIDPKIVLALPKGLVDPGEKPEETALREVREETGVTATLIAKLADIKYVYVRSWGDKEKVFKIVTFYLLRYQSGRIDEVTPEMRVEVRRALWLPARRCSAQSLPIGGERQVVRKAPGISANLIRRTDRYAAHATRRTHFTAGLFVRDVVIGMADGLTVPFALAAGLSGAVRSTRLIVVGGLAEIAAGSIAMGLGGYLAARGDAEHYDHGTAARRARDR